MDAASWSAIAAWATFAVAAVAALAAFGQVREAQRLRREQAQPYVVAYIEPSAVSPQFADLVIRNLGATAARDVTVKSDPPLERSGDDLDRSVITFDSLPILVPKQEWRTFWDSGLDRKGAQAPEQYRVTVRYRSSVSKKFLEEHYILDWSTMKGRIWVNQYGLHDIAKSVRELQRDMRHWREGTSGLKVYVRDGDQKDERQQAYFDEMRRSAETPEAEQQ